MAGTPEELATGLSRLLDGAEVADLTRLSGGASRETWSFRAGSGHRLVLQRQRPSAVERPGIGPVVEAELLRAARAVGVPVPEVVAASAAADGNGVGAPFLLVAAVEGETIARHILREDRFARARSRLTGQCAEALAALHQLPADAVDGLGQTDPLEQLREIIDLLGEPHPALELGFRWLDRHRPPPTPGGPRIVHGDFRLGNLIVGEEGLRAVLDWELAHLGDPIEDLGWLCVKAWRFGSPRPVAGVGDYDELRARYSAASGNDVDPDVLRWWEALGTLRWGVICVMQAAAHLSGAVRSHELAAIGRRVCQTEHDLLLLLPGGGPPVSSPAAASSEERPWPTGPHDRPTVPELLEAVREWLRGDLMAGTDGQLRFHTRVAANMVAMAERELVLGPAQAEAHARRLSGFGVADDAELATAIRRGDLDGRWDQVKAAVWSSVLDKLAVVDPRYAEVH